MPTLQALLDLQIAYFDGVYEVKVQFCLATKSFKNYVVHYKRIQDFPVILGEEITPAICFPPLHHIIQTLHPDLSHAGCGAPAVPTWSTVRKS